MNAQLPSMEEIISISVILTFLSFTLEYFGNLIFESFPFLENLLAKNGKWLKGASFKRMFLTFIGWQITSGFHFGVITKFLKPDFEIATYTASLDYFITAGIIGGGSAIVYEYTKRLKANTEVILNGTKKEAEESK